MMKIMFKIYLFTFYMYKQECYLILRQPWYIHIQNKKYPTLMVLTCQGSWLLPRKRKLEKSLSLIPGYGNDLMNLKLLVSHVEAVLECCYTPFSSWFKQVSIRLYSNFSFYVRQLNKISILISKCIHIFF